MASAVYTQWPLSKTQSSRGPPTENVTWDVICFRGRLDGITGTGNYRKCHRGKKGRQPSWAGVCQYYMKNGLEPSQSPKLVLHFVARDNFKYLFWVTTGFRSILAAILFPWECKCDPKCKTVCGFTASNLAGLIFGEKPECRMREGNKDEAKCVQEKGKRENRINKKKRQHD